MTAPSLAAPVKQSERIFTLDMLRGIAILGILLMNIESFSTDWAASSDPSLMNEFGTINYYLWYAVGWIFNGTQRAMFSMLFGAGIVLFISRQEKKFDGLTPADYFFRRQLWLMLFSLIDVYILLWNGDILLDYACYGMMLFVFRNWSPKALIIAAGVCVLLMLVRENRDLYEQKAMIQKGEAVAAIDTTRVKLTGLQKNALEEMKGFKTRTERAGKLKRLEESKEKVTHSYESVYAYRTGNYLDHLIGYLYMSLWDVLIFMFLGMAFFKLGILTGTAPIKIYAWLCVGGLTVGLSLSWVFIQLQIENGYSWFNFTKNVDVAFYELTRTPRAVGLLGLIMLMYKSNWFAFLFRVLRPVGQMAFTNYLMQSLICGIIFNAYGFKLFAQLQRYESYLVVLGIWIIQIIYSNIWMRLFLFGPFEWAWRSLTYWKRQPFVKPAW